MHFHDCRKLIRKCLALRCEAVYQRDNSVAWIAWWVIWRCYEALGAILMGQKQFGHGGHWLVYFRASVKIVWPRSEQKSRLNPTSLIEKCRRFIFMKAGRLHSRGSCLPQNTQQRWHIGVTVLLLQCRAISNAALTMRCIPQPKMNCLRRGPWRAVEKYLDISGTVFWRQDLVFVSGSFCNMLLISLCSLSKTSSAKQNCFWLLEPQMAYIFYLNDTSVKLFPNPQKRLVIG